MRVWSPLGVDFASTHVRAAEHMLDVLLGVTGDVRFGYIVLPKDTTKVGQLIAEWTAADLETADERARDVVRSLRRQAFWPPSATPDFAEDFAPICMDNVFERPRYLTETST